MKRPLAERVHIGFFGRKNAGKSSVMNAVTGQDLSVVSPVGGTTNDPVQKGYGTFAHRAGSAYGHAGTGR